MSETNTFIIDNNLRCINIPDGANIFGVAGDIEVKQVSFEMPRYYNGIDMSEFSIFVDYENAKGDRNYYKVVDIKTHSATNPQSSDNITFTWLLESDVTAYQGTVVFAIRMVKRDGTKIIKQFDTDTATGIVLDGMNVFQRVPLSDQKDILGKIENDVVENIQENLNNHTVEKKTELNAYTDEKKKEISDLTEISKTEIEKTKDDAVNDLSWKELVDKNTAAISSLKEDIVKIGTKIVSENLLDYSKVESGYYDLNGVFHESDTYAHVKLYVDDLVGKTIYFSRDNGSSIISIDVSFITEYDSNGSAMHITNAKNVNNYTIPDGVAYVIISATTINLSSKVMITLNFVPEKFIPYFEPYFKANDRFALELKSQIDTSMIVECWGNSLTKGVGASENNYENAYPNQLQKMLGDSYIVNNLGIGGEGVKQIAARQGGKLSFAQPFTIPKGTIATNVSFLNDDGEDIKHQTQKGNGVNPCYINGVKGTVAWDKSNLTNTFTRETAGHEIKISRETPLITDGMINHRGNIMVIWAGTNDKPKTKEKAQYIIDSIRDMIAYAKTEKYIVIGLTSKAYMGDFIDTCTKMWSQNFGTKFVNARKYLMNYALSDESITPTEQDNLDIENGEIPSSLRSDSVHLNAKGYHCIAKLVYERGKLLGYW